MVNNSGSLRFFFIVFEVSYAHQTCIYVNTIKNYIVKYYFNKVVKNNNNCAVNQFKKTTTNYLRLIAYQYNIYFFYNFTLNLQFNVNNINIWYILNVF